MSNYKSTEEIKFSISYINCKIWYNYSNEEKGKLDLKK